MPDKTIVLVHGAWHGSWVWSRVIEELKNDDVDIQTVELPSCGEPGELGDLRDDVEAVRSAMEAIEGPVILVGHSYGGMAVTEAAAGADNVAHLVYVCAFMLDEGESLLGAVGGRPPGWWHYSADESYISADTPMAVFYNDCSAEVAGEAVAHLKQFSASAPEQTLDAAAWHEMLSTYVICTKDKAIPPEGQEAMSDRAGTVEIGCFTLAVSLKARGVGGYHAAHSVSRKLLAKGVCGLTGNVAPGGAGDTERLPEKRGVVEVVNHQVVNHLEVHEPATGTRAPAGPSGGSSGAATDERLIQLWLHGKSVTTRRAYEGDLAKLFDFTGGKPLAHVTLADLQEFSDLLSEAVAPATHARTIAALKSLFSFAHDVGYLQFEVTKPLKVPPRKDNLAEKLLSQSEVHDMISAAKRHSKRDGAMLKLMYAAGLRSAEATGLKWRDVTDRGDGRGQLTVFGKGGKTRNVLVPQSVHREMSQLRKGITPDDPIFRSRKKGGHLDGSQVRRIVARAGKDAGLEVEVSPHDLRHAHASHSSDSGAPLHLVRATLGHSSIATTGRYLHARPNESSATYLGFT